MWQLCSSPDFSPSCDPLKAVRLDVHGACVCFLVGFLAIRHTDSIKWIWSGGTVLFFHGEAGQTAQHLSACSRVFPGVPCQDCGYKPGCCLPITCQLWQLCHQLLIRTHFGLRLKGQLWEGPGWGSAPGPAISSPQICSVPQIGLSTNVFVQDYPKNSNLAPALVYYFWGFQKCLIF